MRSPWTLWVNLIQKDVEGEVGASAGFHMRKTSRAITALKVEEAPKSRNTGEHRAPIRERMSPPHPHIGP